MFPWLQQTFLGEEVAIEITRSTKKTFKIKKKRIYLSQCTCTSTYVKTCEAFLCFVAMSLVSVTGFYTKDESKTMFWFYHDQVLL